MRILNRPMFKYGGPIKEGVMHGMRDGGSIAGGHQIGTPMGNRTGFADPYWSTVGAAAKPILKSWMKPWKKWKNPFTIAKKVIDKGKQLTLPGISQPGITSTGAGSAWMAGPAKYWGHLKKAKPLAKNLWGKHRWKTAIGAPIAAPYVIDMAKKIPFSKIGDLGKGYVEKWKDVLGIGDGEKDETDKIDTGTKIKPIGPGAQFEHTAPILTESQKTKLAKEQQNTRLKSYLDMMGYDSAKKGALSKALIDASAVVQQGTEEAGSLKEADWGKLINKMIQTTSRRLEKPEQIREAVGLMMTKGAIEKDIAEGKGGALKQNARDLVAAGVYKTEREAMKHLAKKTSFEDVLIAIAGKQGDVTGAHLEDAWRMSESGIPKARVKATDEIYENFVDKNEKLADIELEFVDRKIKDKQPGDVYVIDDRMVIIQADGTPKYRW